MHRPAWRQGPSRYTLHPRPGSLKNFHINRNPRCGGYEAFGVYIAVYCLFGGRLNHANNSSVLFLGDPLCFDTGRQSGRRGQRFEADHQTHRDDRASSDNDCSRGGFTDNKAKRLRERIFGFGSRGVFRDPFYMWRCRPSKSPPDSMVRSGQKAPSRA
jgi:hypothetical protein